MKQKLFSGFSAFFLLCLFITANFIQFAPSTASAATSLGKVGWNEATSTDGKTIDGSTHLSIAQATSKNRFVFQSPTVVQDTVTKLYYVTSASASDMFYDSNTNFIKSHWYWYWPTTDPTSPDASALTEAGGNCLGAFLINGDQPEHHGDEVYTVPYLVQPSLLGIPKNGKACGVGNNNTNVIGTGSDPNDQYENKIGQYNSVDMSKLVSPFYFKAKDTLSVWGANDLTIPLDTPAAPIISQHIKPLIKQHANLANQFQYFTDASCIEADDTVDSWVGVLKAGNGANTTYTAYVYNANGNTDWDDNNTNVDSCLFGGKALQPSPNYQTDSTESLVGIDNGVFPIAYPENDSDNPPTAVATSTVAGTDASAGCGAAVSIVFNPLNWVMCPLILAAGGAVDGLDSLITSLLTIGSNGSSDNPCQIFNDDGSVGTDTTCTSGNDAKTSAAYYKAWQSVRNIALGLMVIAGMFIVISQTLGFEILDAYTIKKVLPRLIIAAIGLTLSWPLMRLMVVFTNDAGLGIRNLIYQPFTTSGLSTSVTLGWKATTVLGPVLLGSAFILGPIAVLSFLLTGLLAVLIAFLVLVIRQVVITTLIILAPIAIVCSILPNTNNIFKLWWDSFSRGLLMFPIIAAFIASGRVLAVVGNGSGSTFGHVVGFVAYFAPYFLLPLTFRFAGGAIRGLGGFVNDRSRGGFDRLKGFRKNQQKKRMADLSHRAAGGNLFKGAQDESKRGRKTLRGRINRGVEAGLMTAAEPTGFNPRQLRSRVQANLSNAKLAHDAKAAEAKYAKGVFGDDDVQEAARRYDTFDGRVNYLESLGRSPEMARQGAALIKALEDEIGTETLQRRVAVQIAGTRTGYANGPGEMLDAIAKAANGDGAVMASMIAEARQLAEGARRFDLSGASHGEQLEQAINITSQTSTANRARAVQSATAVLTDRVVESQGPGVIMSGNGQSVRNLAPALTRMLDKNMDALNSATTPEARQKANTNVMRTLAQIASLQDVAGQVSKENGEDFASTVLGHTYVNKSDPSQSITASQMLENARGDTTFRQLHKEYGLADADARAAAAASGQPPGGTPGPRTFP